MCMCWIAEPHAHAGNTHGTRWNAVPNVNACNQRSPPYNSNRSSLLHTVTVHQHILHTAWESKKKPSSPYVHVMVQPRGGLRPADPMRQSLLKKKGPLQQGCVASTPRTAARRAARAGCSPACWRCTARRPPGWRGLATLGSHSRLWMELRMVQMLWQGDLVRQQRVQDVDGMPWCILHAGLSPQMEPPGADSAPKWPGHLTTAPG